MTGDETANHAIPGDDRPIMACDAPGHFLADDGLGRDGLVHRNHFEIVMKQMRHLLPALKGSEKEFFCVERCLKGKELIVGCRRHVGPRSSLRSLAGERRTIAAIFSPELTEKLPMADASRSVLPWRKKERGACGNARLTT